MNRLVTETKKVLLLGTLLLLAFSGWAQVYKNGIRQGQIKVKFAAEMTNTLAQTTVNARTSGFTSGISSVDNVAKATKASNMYRLFPYDPKFEHKLRKHGLHLWYVVEIDETVDPKTALAQFKQLNEITAAEVEFEKLLAPYSVKPYEPGASTFSSPPFNDPLLKDQWHYNNNNQTGYSDADVNLFSAWQTTTGANNIIVSVHDEGVDVNHADLKANIWVNADEIPGNGVDDDGNGYKDDVNGYNFAKNKGAVDAQYHGTHVAGTIAAVNNNGIGVGGVAGGNGTGNGVKIMSLQIIGGGPIEKSYIYAANNGAVISQNSWGYTNPYAYEQSVLDAIDYFVAEAGDYEGSPMRGGIVIFAAGNSSYDSQWYPGYYESTLSVAALGPEWKIASYSNYGAWVDIAAPGGDQDYGIKNGVLSTIPNDQYAYLQGTSMACPHVSGIAALALANRNEQLTSVELRNKLVTGVVSIDEHNPNFIGKLGSGAIDAVLAIKNDQGKVPLTISNLTVKGVSQEFAQLSWSVPADEDDGKPVSFNLYYHTEPITASNIATATKVIIKNTSAVGATINYELGGLLGLTTYHFAITSTDRWGNFSALSNVPSATTNEGPSIAVGENSQSINFEIDASVNAMGSTDITILNQAAGILRWNHTMRHKNSALAYNASSLKYPTAPIKKQTDISVGRVNSHTQAPVKQEEVSVSAFTPLEKVLASWPTNIVGETDLTLPNSAAGKFFVSEPNGFNLTQVRMYLKQDPAKGPVIVEVYKGSSPIKANLVYAQEYSHWSASETWAYITLNEQLYFENGTTFWVALHVPAGNKYPLGIGFESAAANSTFCYYSTNVGATWMPLEEALNENAFAWAMVAASYNEHLGNYLTLEPGSGDVNGFEQTTTTLTANAATLINGTYSANVVLTSNDVQNRELRIPISINVTGHKPDIDHIDIADYGSVFRGTTKTMELEFDNKGYGNFNSPYFSIDNPAFTIDGYAPGEIKARENAIVKIKFSPVTTGNVNGTLTITNGDQTYHVALVGVGTETPTITLTPENQTVNNVTIGDVVNAQITVENTGAYPLKYFIPGFDTKGVSENWPTNYHSYGYKYRTNYPSETNPVSYEFQNISSTGTKITDLFRDDEYYTLDMGFKFPFYADQMETIYIAKKGFTTFDNSVRPINVPTIPGNQWSPKGYISILGTYFNYVLSPGEIYYQVEADRVIIQYDNVGDGWTPGNLTAQIVLYADGNIRFFYDNIEWSSESTQYLSILIEDMNQSDGILINNWSKPIDIYSGLAIGLDYPGPNIITAIQNGSGIVSPGSSVVVDVTMNTATLSEGLINRYVNFISNDPFNGQKAALVQLNINAGGTAQPVVSIDTVAFGNVFQGANRSVAFTIKNPGTANLTITSMNLVSGDFILTGETTTTINSGLFKKYDIKIPTANLASLEDWLSINYADGSHDTIYITGTVVVPPAINVDLSLLQHTQAYGEKSSHPYAIENTGLAPLEVAAVGTQWMSFETNDAPNDHGYVVEQFNDGSFYQWIDIRKTGTQMPFVDFANDWAGTFWRELTLPFPIEFYGVSYTSMKIGDNGIISFENEPEASLFTDFIPSETHPGPCIMPYWTFSTFSDYLYPLEDIGIFYKFYDDKFIITWSYFTNNFGGMGDPVSAQVIFYKNGTMKFQYKREEGGSDITSHFGTIGLQKNSTTGIAISEYEVLDHGQGLAFVISPVKKYVVAPSTTLTGNIVLDATNIYGGQYNGSLKIHSNAPNTELLEKPVELVVTGDAVIDAPASHDFGQKMVVLEGWSYASHTADMTIGNSGAAPLEISWIQMADGYQGLSLMLEVDDFGGKQWVDIANIYSWQNPVYKINPNDELQVRAVFSPSYGGLFTDDVVFTTNAGEYRITLSGTAVDPPVMQVDESDIEVEMIQTTEMVTRSIAISNEAGQSDLNYAVSIDYGRGVTSRTESIAASNTVSTSVVASEKAQVSAVSGATTTYNRTIKHSERTIPDTHVGIGGAFTFSVATKFNAGAQGFTLSHIETWFRAETLSQGVINVEVRAGGNNIASAATLGQGQLSFTSPAVDEAGSWHTIALDEAIGIYPNEDFYVLITYPLGIEFPQGTLTDLPTVSGRYYFYSEGTWYNVQEVNGFSTAGWLMYAAEETAGNTSWISITSPLEATLEAGMSGTIDIKIEGAYAKRGDQVAKINVTSNDPYNTKDEVSVTLHLNEAPHYENVPEVVYMGEGEVVTLSIPVVDEEGNNFIVAPAQTYSRVTHNFANGVLVITLSPDYGDEGIYTYIYKATDEHNAVGELNLNVVVAHSNRAPLYIGDEESMQFTASGELAEYAVEDWFNDPDDDEFTFTVTSNNAQVVQVLTSPTQFAVKPVAVGEAQLTFVVTDLLGASTTYAMDVTVTPVLGIEDGDVNFSLTAYPNPSRGKVYLHVEGEIRNEFAIRVISSMGVTVMSSNVTVQQRDAEIDLSHLQKGIYFIEITDSKGRSTRRVIKQ